MFVIPTAFARFMLELHGSVRGQSWLDCLPTILAMCEQRWRLTIAPPFDTLSFNYVAPATRDDGSFAVVKVCPPGGEFAQQVEALRLFAGRGAVRLLEYDNEDETMLLEHAQPGVLLSTIEDDDEAISHASAVMRRLWHPAPSKHPFPTVADWGKGFARLHQHYDGGNGPFPAPLLAKAEALFAELNASMTASALLHGDLHQENILQSGEQCWLAIDPKGLIGEPAYETGALLRNPLPQLLNAPQPGRILARRIDQLSDELGIDRARIHGWGLAQAVLSAWWCVEDTGNLGDDVLACAELLAAIKV